MIAGSISRRYAKALLQLGVDGHNYDALGRELGHVNATIEGSDELREALTSPIFPLSQRKAILAEVLARLGVSKWVEHFVLLLMDRNRIAALPAITREYGLLADGQAGRVRALVTSATALSPTTERRLKLALEQRTGKQVIVEQRVDPSLIGGVVVQIGDLVYDGSVRIQLANLREQLLAS